MQNNKLLISARLSLAFTLVCYSIVSYSIERILSGNWANFNHAIGSIVLGWYFLVFYKEHREIMMTSFYQIFYFLGLLLSAALVSGGMYMIEIDQFGDQNGVFWVLIIFFVAGLESNRIGYLKSGKLILENGLLKFSTRVQNLLILSITIIALAVSTYVLLIYRGPVLLNIDRVTFWREVAPSYLSFLPSLIVQSFFFVAFYFLWSMRNRRKKLLPTIILSAYILVGLFILGQKFSLFILFITVWLALIPGVYKKFYFKQSYIFGVAIVTTFLVTIVLISYASQGKELSFIFSRIALQAQLIWSVYNDSGAHDLWPSTWTCYFGCDQFANGSQFISYKYLPSIRYNSYYDSGNVLSGFMPALPIITIGLAASLLTHIAISFILGIVQSKLVVAVSKKNVIYSFLLYKTHVGITLIWYAAMQTAIAGLILTLILIGLYRLCINATIIKRNL